MLEVSKYISNENGLTPNTGKYEPTENHTELSGYKSPEGELVPILAKKKQAIAEKNGHPSFWKN